MAASAAGYKPDLVGGSCYMIPRRTWLRGRENVHKRCLIHVVGYNLELIMRLLTGAGTPRGFRARVSVWFGVLPALDGGWILLFVAVASDQIAALAANLRPDSSA